MTKTLKSLVLAAAVLSTSGAMAQDLGAATSKCGETAKCFNFAELQQGATGGSATVNANQTATGGSQYGAVSGGNTTNVSVTTFQPGVVNLTQCLVKGTFNQACVAKKLKEVEASLKPYSKCDPKGDQTATAKCGFSFKQ